MSTNIEWTDETWNPTRGCTPVSEGCLNCYAMRQAVRQSAEGGNYEGLVRSTSKGPKWTGRVRLVHDNLEKPLHWRKPRRVFVDSMSDLFHENIPDSYIAAVFATMAMAPRHTFQVLTKRPERMREMLSDGFDAFGRPMDVWPLPNVWVGVSCEDQKAANERIPYLIATPAAVRFLSCEPLLGPIDLTKIDEPMEVGLIERTDALTGDVCSVDREDDIELPWRTDPPIDWLIAGGESGPRARQCRLEWIEDLVAQCDFAGVPCFVKQLGSQPWEGHSRLDLADRKGGDMAEWPERLRVRQFPEPAGVAP